MVVRKWRWGATVRRFKPPKGLQWTGRLLAAALFVGLPAFPAAAGSAIGGGDCLQWAYDVTIGAPRLVWVNACAPPAEQDPDAGGAGRVLPDITNPVIILPPKNVSPVSHAAPRPQKDTPPARRSPRLTEPPVFPLPLDSGWWLSSPFGPRTDPFTGQPDFHHGVDLAAPEGTPVRACNAGTVIWAGPGGAYGLAVGIRHADGRVTWYGHLSEVLVGVGQVVHRAEVIGRVGSTGRATGPHLHFEMRERGRRVDPWPSLARLLDEGQEEKAKGGDPH